MSILFFVEKIATYVKGSFLFSPNRQYCSVVLLVSLQILDLQKEKIGQQ